ncbi:transmembrane protein 163 [Biomphalaria pfeifferi]|uniref:Transmembrane protein 163 n=1 Tax=Biomphalaria pfeifferi TaxID=112525 RepID=A0AAD8C403_BIOPF|nr:transmembrane protein 163 [Biomphalaria pfeifferi]
MEDTRLKSFGQRNKQPSEEGNSLGSGGISWWKRKCSDPEEKSTLIVNRKDLSPEATQRLLTSALVISWASIIFSLGTGLAALVLSVHGNSESLFAFGLDAVLDSLSSCAVLWRFHGNVDCVYSLARERKACIAIGVLFLVSAASLIIKSAVAIANETHEEEEVVLFDSFALTCGIISVFIGASKVYVGLKLRSQALYTDSIITFVGAASCFAGVAGLELYVNNTKYWYVDSVFGILCGLFLLFFGIKLLYTTLKEKS